MPNDDRRHDPPANPDRDPPFQTPRSQAAPQQNEMREDTHRRPTNEENETVKLERDIRMGETWLIVINALLLITNIVIASIYYGQLREMRKATFASQKSADAAKGAADTAAATLKEVQSSSTDTRRLAVAAGTQADAAKSQAESLVKLVSAATTSANVQSQVVKPIVVLDFVGIFHSEQFTKAWAVVRVQNNGSTDAQFISIAARFRASDPKLSDYKFPTSNFKPTSPDILRPFSSTKDSADSVPIVLSDRLSPGDNSRRLYVFGKIRFQDTTRNTQPDVLFCSSIVVDLRRWESGPSGYGGTWTDCLKTTNPHQ